MSVAEFESRKDFAKAIEKGVALVDFNATWCAPCRAQDPIIAGLEKNYLGRACIVKVDIDDIPAVAMGLGIQSIPTLILFKEGREVRRFIGLQTAETLSGAIDRALEQ